LTTVGIITDTALAVNVFLSHTVAKAQKLWSIDVCVITGDNCTNGCVVDFNNLNNNDNNTTQQQPLCPGLPG